ncbi:hypothetical protein LZ31DRAFT_501822 [Colletotrichum somersetense]|nr:hypothetical protein LZ31DRAFT_501822 [Colletotrichum somersetense]
MALSIPPSSQALTNDQDFHNTKELHRSYTGLTDDENAFDLGSDEEEFEPQIATVTGFDDQDHVKLRFQRDLEDASSLFSIAPKTVELKKQAMAFVVDRMAEWGKTTREGQTFLHYLAYYDYKYNPSVNLTWLMTRAIFKLPHLMGVMDNSKRTPLTVALSRNNGMFTYAACNNLPPPATLSLTKALRSECVKNREMATCLHTALDSTFDSEERRETIIKTMCKFVPKEMFTIEDPQGRVPLHLAIEYERCCKAQIGIVDEMLLQGPEALTVEFTPPFSDRPLSIYQYFERSRRRAAKPSATQQKKTLQNIATYGKGPRDTPSSLKVESKSIESRTENGAMEPPPLPDARVDRVESGLPRRESFPTATLGGNETPRSNERKARVSTVTRTSGGSAQNAIEQALQKEEDREKAAQTIGEQLKLHYLRTQPPGRILHLLHSPEEKAIKEMWFDFGPPRTFTKDNFGRHFDHLQFDSVLQYVAFPRIQLEKKKDEVSDTRQKSRTDLTFFFNWLKEKKKVKRILTVIVDDLEPPFHSDEAIEEALESFDVEILDWRRPDLDPVTLERVGKCLRKVYLQWSGRNTVLRAWSEPDGLAKILTLKSIHLNQIEDLESEERTMKNINEFEKRIRETWPPGLPPPKVIRPKLTGDIFRDGGLQLSVQMSHNDERPIDPHKWMQCMADFAKHFRQVRVFRDPVTDQSLGPVQVALIDDGADTTHAGLEGIKFRGQSFCHYWDGTRWRVSPYWHSSSGHGTAMAMLIHHVCPSAIIHVIKLDTFESSSRLQIRPESAIQAIRYAIEQGVHIMCMSWTMKPPLKDSIRDEFEDEIIKAGKKGILMFCAASDQGKTADQTYPHSIGTKSFRIGAAKATGATASNVGDADWLSYTFPGHEGTIESVYGTGIQKLEGHSGSSVANALATGLAALIIECVRLGVFHTSQTGQLDPTVAIHKEDLSKIRKREQMDFALKSIGTNRNTGHKYIEVWQIFSRAAENLKHAGDATSQLDVIAGLARHFLGKNVLM